MSEAHVCDGCLTVAPIGQALRWWKLEAMDSYGTQSLTLSEKPEYHACSWGCLQTIVEKQLALRNIR